jgi:hypothetical protein
VIGLHNDEVSCDALDALDALAVFDALAALGDN